MNRNMKDVVVEFLRMDEGTLVPNNIQIETSLEDVIKKFNLDETNVSNILLEGLIRLKTKCENFIVISLV